MFTKVVKAEYVDGYRIRLWFNNQVTKVVDLQSSLKGKVFEPLKTLSSSSDLLSSITRLSGKTEPISLLNTCCHYQRLDYLESHSPIIPPVFAIRYAKAGGFFFQRIDKK